MMVQMKVKYRCCVYVIECVVATKKKNESRKGFEGWCWIVGLVRLCGV